MYSLKKLDATLIGSWYCGRLGDKTFFFTNLSKVPTAEHAHKKDFNPSLSLLSLSPRHYLLFSSLPLPSGLSCVICVISLSLSPISVFKHSSVFLFFKVSFVSLFKLLVNHHDSNCGDYFDQVLSLSTPNFSVHEF